MRKTSPYSFIICAFLQFINLHAQQNPQNYENHIQSITNDDVITITHTIQSSNLELHDQNVNFIERLKFNNRIIYLNPNEQFEAIGKNKLLTTKMQKSETSTARYLNSYFIDGDSLKFEKSIVVDENASFSFTKNSQNIILSDEYEGLGYEITLLSSSLNKVMSYRPFGNSGFKQSLFELGDKKAGFIFFPIDTSNKAKLVLLNTDTGQQLFEIELNTSIYDISKLLIIENYVLVKQHSTPQSQELVCYDLNGNIIWKKNEYIYAMSGIKNEGMSLLAMSQTKYWYINMDNGKESERHLVSDIIGDAKIGLNSWIDLTEINDYAEAGFLITEKTPSSETYNHRIFKFNGKQDRPTLVSNFQTNDPNINFLRNSMKMILTDSKNQYIKL